MKWHKYPETKPDKELSGSLLYIKVPRYDVEGYHPENRNGRAIRMGVWMEGKWYFPFPNPMPMPDRLVECITHYIDAAEIPGPEDEAPQEED